MRIRDWSSGVCSSDLALIAEPVGIRHRLQCGQRVRLAIREMRIVADNPELRIALSRDQTVEAFPDEVPFVRCLAVFDQLLAEPRLGFQFAALLAIQLAVQHVLQRESDRKSTRLNSSHSCASRMPSSAFKTQYLQ